MTNGKGEYGKLYKAAWGDPDYRALTEGEQALYQKLLSQPDMSMAGVLTYAPARWARQTADLTVADVEARFTSLSAKRFVVRDPDTDEVLVRSYIRNDGGWRSPKTMIGIGNSVRRVLSTPLRAAISHELLRIDTSDLSENVSERTGKSTRQVVDQVVSELVREVPPRKPEYPIDRVSTSSLTATAPANATAPAIATANAPLPTEEGARSESSGQVALAVASPDGAALKTKRGSRLPDGWTPARSEANLRVESGHGSEWLTDQLGRFRDHWAAQPGAKGVKADWDATWRNWIKRAADYAPKGARPRTFGQMTDDDWAADIAAAKARIA